MNYLVTGGAGFIGSHIVRRLVEKGESVRIIDDFSTGKRENLFDVLERVDLIEGDIRNYRAAREAVDGVDVVLHQAALPSVPRSIKDPIATNEVNVTGTLNILQSARDARVQKVVIASSSSVYGDTPQLPKHERLVPNPLSPYAVSKLSGESYCRVFAQLYGLQTVALRYFNVFGPRQDPNSQYSAVIPKFISAMLKGQRPVIFGDGEQSRDFTYIDNVVTGNILAATMDFQGGLAMNCASHGRTTLNQLVGLINEIIGKDLKPVYGDPRPGDIKHSFADIELFSKHTGYTPIVGMREGLKRTVDFYRADG
jgi:UDP-N-acetylglucosamine/UDP-N-acetyl-alpha-D-glucosaminouronate 4-epimerase